MGGRGSSEPFPQTLNPKVGPLFYKLPPSPLVILLPTEALEPPQQKGRGEESVGTGTFQLPSQTHCTFFPVGYDITSVRYKICISFSSEETRLLPPSLLFCCLEWV